MAVKKNQDSIDDWQRMYDNLTDPDKKAEALREAKKKQRSESKRRDTGL